MADHSPQPQQRAGEAAENEESSRGESPASAARAALAAVRNRPPLARCTECHIALPAGHTGLCQGCEEYLATTDRGRRPA